MQNCLDITTFYSIGSCLDLQKKTVDDDAKVRLLPSDALWCIIPRQTFFSLKLTKVHRITQVGISFFFLNSKQIVLHYLSKFDKHPSLFLVLLFANRKRGGIRFRYYKHNLTVLVLEDLKFYTSVFQPCRHLPHVATAIFNVAIETFFKAENSFMGICFIVFE